MRDLGFVNVVHMQAGSFLLHDPLWKNFHGHPHGEGPYLVLPSLFLQYLPETHPNH
jgi:hypothetical protein